MLGAVAGFCLQKTGFLGVHGWFQKNWLTFYGGNWVFLQYAYMAYQQTPGVAHDVHMYSMAFGYLLGWLLPGFLK